MALLIDALASQPWYADHLLPVMAALGDAAGTFHRLPVLPFRPDTSRPVVVASYGDLAIAKRAGYRRIVMGQHGAGQSYPDSLKPDQPAYAGGARQEAVGLFLVPNEHAAARTRAAYPRTPVCVVGCPKLDTLPAREPGPGPVVALSFHWDNFLCPETRSVLHHYAGVLPELPKVFAVIGHGHPRRRDLRHIYPRIGVEYVPSFDTICRRADVYVCDNSSSLFEFATTGRPVVVLNAPWFRRGAHHGLRFWDAAGVGVNVERPGELVEAIHRALECRREDVAAREAALDLVYQPRTGGAVLAAEAILEWAERPG